MVSIEIEIVYVTEQKEETPTVTEIELSARDDVAYQDLMQQAREINGLFYLAL